MDRPLGPFTPAVDATAGVAAAALFGAASKIRRARVFHPDGAAFHATFVVDPGAEPPTGAALFDQPGRRSAIVRLSRGAGVPEPLPDIFGFAMRVIDAHGPGLHQDLLVNTAGKGLGRFVFVPRRGHGDGQYSSVLPYRVGEQLVLVGASALPGAWSGTPNRQHDLVSAAERGELAYCVEIAPLLGGWRSVATVELGSALTDDESEGLRFNPVENTGSGIAPVGFFQTLRRQAYRGSQAARPRPTG